VPYATNLNSGDIDNAFSIAGRNSLSNIYTFFEYQSTVDVYSKTVVQTATALRTVNQEQNTDDDWETAIRSKLSDKTSTTSIFTFKLINLEGKEVFLQNNTIAEFSIFFYEFTKHSATGIYILNAISADGLINISLKCNLIK
jgi:hypothetical protein